MLTSAWEDSYKMLHSLRRHFSLSPGSKPSGSAKGPTSEVSLGQLRAELEELTLEILRRADVCPSSVSITVEHVSFMADGLPVLRSMIAMQRWDAKSAMRLMLGLAHIERALRRAVAASWFSHVAHFGGVWLHPSDALLQSAGPRELASLLSSLEKGIQTPSEEAVWGPESKGAVRTKSTA